ncbi:hypothetical protein Taro_024182 [Colocasia esculenta]|uniref:G-patch domain-containing protein n=1 Tax=Colocasia esculenta TaxID=4460 RepID=A0A843VAK7_COLES|nr:hypothetical protein [Colocasia esculenta]
MPHLFIPDKGKKPVMSIFDLPSPLDMNQPPMVDEEFEHVPCPQGKGWEVMAKVGYIHGRALGRNEQGPICSVQTRRLLDRAGLGFHPDPVHPDLIPYQPLTWTLKEHFIQGPLQPGTREPVIEELPYPESEEEEEAAEFEEVCEDFGLLSLFGSDSSSPSSSPSSPPPTTEACLTPNSPSSTTPFSLLSPPILSPFLTWPFLEEPALVEADFEEGDSVDDGLGVYLLDFDEKGEPGDLGSEEEDPVSSYVDGTKRFDEPTMAADEPTKEVNLGTKESPKERADVWWASLLRTRFEDDAIEVAWDKFVRLFWAKFIPEHIQDRMEQEFLSLTQGSMTVLEYEARFAELSKYAPHIVTDERRKAKKFVMGLKPSLKTRLVAFDHRTLDEALSAACR